MPVLYQVGLHSYASIILSRVTFLCSIILSMRVLLHSYASIILSRVAFLC